MLYHSHYSQRSPLHHPQSSKYASPASPERDNGEPLPGSSAQEQKASPTQFQHLQRIAPVLTNKRQEANPNGRSTLPYALAKKPPARAPPPTCSQARGKRSRSHGIASLRAALRCGGGPRPCPCAAPRCPQRPGRSHPRRSNAPHPATLQATRTPASARPCVNGRAWLARRETVGLRGGAVADQA